MTLLILAICACVLAAIPALMFLNNLRHFRPAPPQPPGPPPRLSVLIPARNEEDNIGPALETVLASKGVDLEVIVLDDHSEDGTARIVRDFAETNEEVRLEAAPPLPPGWCGKQHACAALAELATRDILVFMDADVRLRPDALARTIAFLEESGADLVSGFPEEVTSTLAEKLIIPLLHFILLGFLPMGWMRSSTRPWYSAGCGQLFATRREAYRKAGGHAAIRASRHDGVTLPRAFREVGLKTDIFDATDTAVCHMYGSFAEVWHGLAKNATEGLGAPSRIVPFTVLLLGGQVMPAVLLPLAVLSGAGTLVLVLSVLAVGLSYLPPLVAVPRFGEPLSGGLLHPVGVALLVAIQWYALTRKLLGRPVGWRGRSYESGSAETPQRTNP
ncbi:MAG: glycosyltransferase family 2 protein [Candidatus Brocadiia bacterium]